MDYVKIKNYSSKNTINPLSGIRYSQYIYLTKNLYPEYINNLHKSIRKRLNNTIEKWAKELE